MTEIEPRLDVSRPTGLRAGGFLLCVVGGLLMGVGAVGTWVTLGIPNETVHTSLHGTDLTDGRVVLSCALLVLVVVITSRLVRSRRLRALLAAVAMIAGLVGAVIAGTFRTDGTDRQAVIEALGIPREMWAQLGAFRDLGPATYVVLAGGLLCAVGGLLTLMWALRTDRTRSVGR